MIKESTAAPDRRRERPRRGMALRRDCVITARLLLLVCWMAWMDKHKILLHALWRMGHMQAMLLE